MTIQKAISPGGRPADDSPIGTPGGKQNWVDKTGGLPKYIREIAHALMRKGMSAGHAIATARNQVRRLMASKNPKVAAAAAAADAEWDAKRAASHVGKGNLGHVWSDAEFIKHLTGETVDMSVIEKQGFKPSEQRGPGGTWVSAGSNVQGGAKRQKSFNKEKGAKNGKWQRLKGTGAAGVSRDTKVGIFTMANGKTAVFMRKGGKDIKVGEYSSPAQANKAAQSTIKRESGLKTKTPKHSSHKSSSGHKSSTHSSSSHTTSTRHSSPSSSRPTPKKVSVKPKAAKKVAKPKKTPQQKAAHITNHGGALNSGGRTALAKNFSDAEFDELSKEVDSFFSQGNADADGFMLAGKIEKKDPEKQLVFGWASIAKLADGTEVVDKQGDVLEDIDAMENVAYDFMLNSRDGGEMHVRKGVSRMVESYVSTVEKNTALGIPEGILPVGWWVGFKVDDANVWEKVKKKEYTMFSVHGSGKRTPILTEEI